MSRLLFLSVFLLFQQNFATEMGEEPQKRNLATKYLNQMLDKVFEEVSKTNLSIPQVDLGEDVGRFSEVQGSVLGGLTKKVDDIGSWGFKLEANMMDVAIGGKYDLVHLEVPLLFPFFGKGRFLISLEAVSLVMQLTAMFNFTAEAFDVNIPQLEIVVRNSQVQFDNLMNDPSLSDFLNELMSNLVPDIVTMLTPPILEFLKPTVYDTANGILLCIRSEWSTSMVEECIRNLFRKKSAIAVKTLYERLTAELIKEPKFQIPTTA